MYSFNLSIKGGVFPDRFKQAIFRPIFKTGSKENVINYRSISLLPVLSKILEIHVKNQLVNYLDKYNILPKSQYGFRKNLGTSDATFSLLNEIHNKIENKEFALGFFCDLSEAFDCVDHSLMLNKLEYYNIRDIPLL